jgi:hypothetical protein
MSHFLSSAGHLLLGYERKDPSVVNSTPQSWQDLASPLAQAAANQLKNPNTYQGPYTADMTGGEQQALGGVQQASQGVGQYGMGYGALQQQANGQMNPFTQFNPFAGAARMSGAEQQGLNQVGQTAFGANPMTDATNQSIMGLMSGQKNPYVDQLIASAQRPILDNFSDQALQQRGLYTGAGQQIQGEGSSPFAMASARLVGNTTGALNDASLGIANNAYNQDMQARLQGAQMGMQQPGMQLQNQLAGLNALSLPRQIQQQGMDSRNQAFQQMQAGQQSGYENAQNRQLQAGQALNSADLAGQQANLQAQLQNLQSQGLPRLIAQQGIDAGLGQFNTQQSQLLQLMQQIGAMANPNTSVLGGMASENGAVQQAGNSFMQGMGSMMSDRRVKKDIQRAGEIDGIPMYRFRYMEDNAAAPLRMGVMADEVEHIPDAVTRVGPHQIAFVNYDKVFARA